VEDVFSRLDPVRVAQELDPIMRSVLEKVIDTVARKRVPQLWDMLPLTVRQELVAKAHEDGPKTVAAIMADVKVNIANVFDLEEMVVAQLAEDKALLNNIFIRCGYQELCFIRNSGAYMGGLFGLIQMAVWIFYQGQWMLPVIGFIVGALTNWLALMMIFRPVNPVTICGILFHGLFLRRQREVAVEYGKIVATHVLTARNIITAMVTGTTTDRLFAIVQQHVQKACDDYAGLSKTMLRFTVGLKEYETGKREIGDMIIQIMPESLRVLEAYTDAALRIEETLVEKMSGLPSAEFEALLHPVFEEDEWKLVLMGGVLGVMIGLLQIFLIF